MAAEDVQVGQRVARLRGDRSQKFVADAMRKRGWKWSQATMWSIESGERPLRLLEAHDLVSVLGAHLMDLFRDPELLDMEGNIRAWIRDVEEDYTRAVEHLQQLMGGQNTLLAIIKDPKIANDQRLSDVIHQAQAAARLTPERALKKAMRLAEAPWGEADGALENELDKHG